jgi:hypothetical protein
VKMWVEKAAAASIDRVPGSDELYKRQMSAIGEKLDDALDGSAP